MGSEKDTCDTYMCTCICTQATSALIVIFHYSPEVSLCTYNVPHPSKHCINVRIQTKGAPAIDVLQKGLEDLSDICDHIINVFQV